MTKVKSKTEIQKFINEYWLNLGDTSQINVFNSLYERTVDDERSPALWLLKYLKNPDNFAFTCKHILNIDLLPFQLVVLKELWFRPFPMLIASRGFSKTFTIALYSILRILFTPNTKMVITGAGLRQSRLVYDYVYHIYRNAPVLRSIIPNSKEQGPNRAVDRFTFTIGNSIASFLPVGDGSRIRGERSNYTLTDEFDSVDATIYEEVIRPFSSVTSSPIMSVKEYAKEQAIRALGLTITEDQLYIPKKNQTAIAGTAGYCFKHFYKYWSKYKAIIESGGDTKKLERIFDGKIPEGTDYRDYSIIRIPYQLLPKGFLDVGQVAASKATLHTGRFLAEYGSEFIKDTNGFFPRTLIESCVVSPNNAIRHPSASESIMFQPLLKGDGKREYVMAIDPAAQRDNYAIVILEVHPEHCRIVYCWTINKRKFFQKLAKTKDLSDVSLEFYGHCARKIRNLMKVFPIKKIALDTQGGGASVEESLHAKHLIESGEEAIYPIIDRDDAKITDNLPGQHIIERISFADAKWTGPANHNMKKDLEDKRLLFPYVDPVSYELAIQEDFMSDRLENTLEELIDNIEEMKEELTTIVVTETDRSGREHFDVPEIKDEITKKKGRLRKDRYSALLMANAIGRSYRVALPTPEYNLIGGVAGHMKKGDGGPSNLYTGCDWAQGITEDCLMVVQKRFR